MSYFTGLEAQNREKYKTFAQFWGGSVVQAPPFGAVWRGSILRGAVDCLQKAAKFLKNIEVLVVGPKSASLKTSTT